ncbi:hypothetical protein AB7Z57_11310 [Providencia alcalifaciens]|uniref:hypothetical protein n=1 Tax=Providencia rettgeri TaxID=587 RepID=UPI00165594F3|nr:MULTISPECIES: hypothetical protein [Providencia]ELR5106844.1 hypothetical protein [Providencia rettgeri]MBC8655097.1 hypothetical protein [Providencia vermicola]
MKRILAVAAVVALLAGCGGDRPDAPYGHKWGQTIDEVKKTASNEFECEVGDRITICVDGFATIEFPSMQSVMYFFTKNEGLVQIDLRSKAFDRGANEATESIDELSKLSKLIKKDYNPKSEELISDKENLFRFNGYTMSVKVDDSGLKSDVYPISQVIISYKYDK